VANFPAITHVALTVTDLDRSAVWYERLLGVEPVLDEDAGGFYHKVYPLSGGMLLGLHLHPGGDNGEQFRVTRPGLDHVAFGCASRDELTEWQARLEELGITTGSSTRPTAQDCPSKTPTAPRWSSSHHPPDIPPLFGPPSP